MSGLNWDLFAGLPGASTHNFEMLCRTLIRRHYGKFGQFRALSNQPGVEFHLKLRDDCSLGKKDQWFGWQCRWYELQSGTPIGTTRREKILDAITKTAKELPQVTDWVLWTRHPLTKADQTWFYDITSTMQLHAWTTAEVEEHLCGPCEILRATYFGELVLTRESLEAIHGSALARIANRWHPEVHQTVDSERAISRMLADDGAWQVLLEISARLKSLVSSVETTLPNVPETLKDCVGLLCNEANNHAVTLAEVFGRLEKGDYESLREIFDESAAPYHLLEDCVRKLRSARHTLALLATNILADVYAARETCSMLVESLSTQLVAVVAEAGCGKTHLSAKISQSSGIAPPGLLLFGADLHANQNLNDLAHNVVIQGKPVSSFEALIAALNATGQRAGRRIPLVIDGLSESEDPRKWKTLLAQLGTQLREFEYIVVIVTLRTAFVSEALPARVVQIEQSGFEHDINEAIGKYCNHYKIDSTDAEVPLGLLNHPLTLRMFCEVTNPRKDKIVGLECMPNSLVGLFELFLNQTAVRISELSPSSHPYQASEVLSALTTFGTLMWEQRSRTVSQTELRDRLFDQGRPWSRSIVRMLEDSGVLIRVSEQNAGPGSESFVFDLLGGYVIADALLQSFDSTGFENWLNTPDTVTLLHGPYGKRHPLAEDIFQALVGLSPHRMHGVQVWKIASEAAKPSALFLAAWLEARFIDPETVRALETLVSRDPVGRRGLFSRLRSTRSSISHPLNSAFLNRVLKSMTIAGRDLRWSEWIRRNESEVVEDITVLAEAWTGCDSLTESDVLRAQWVMWLLTSSSRTLRDLATFALYRFGMVEPQRLFDLTLKSLEFNDPYISERMLAASYGVSMSLWSDPAGNSLRSQLPAFANSLVELMWAPDAPYPSWHTLKQDYSLGVIELAQKIDPICIGQDRQLYLKSPYPHLPTPFKPFEKIENSVELETRWAIQMDFGNYMIGGLIPDRSNYDYKHPEYQAVRRQIEGRMVELGYNEQEFSSIDNEISGNSWRGRRNNVGKVDRYGKKYSWIAYFEMYGIRRAGCKLPKWRMGDRTPDVDIDPSFPGAVECWFPNLPEVFADSPKEIRTWYKEGPCPDYEFLLARDEIDLHQDSWVLLDGFIKQANIQDGREVFTFLRSVFVSKSRVSRLLKAFNEIEYPGNHQIPEPLSDYYTFAGEIPWSSRFGGEGIRKPNGEVKRSIDRAFEQASNGGVRVEIPVHIFSWESHHSELNNVSGVTYPSPAICKFLHLGKHCGKWDLFDSVGRLATVYRRWEQEHNNTYVNLFYLRKDLLAEYLAHTKQNLVWLMWGERQFDYHTFEEHRQEIQSAHDDYSFIHRKAKIWES